MVNKKEVADRLMAEYGDTEEDTGAEDAAVAPKRGTQADRLIELVSDTPAEFFTDQLRVAHCATRGDGTQVMKLRSAPFGLWLRHLYWQAEGTAPNKNAVETALAHLEAKAAFDSSEIPLAVRVARREEEIWYDLGEKAVRITSDGWQVVDEPPIIFRRFPSQSSQVEPRAGGHLEDFLSFTRVRGKRDEILLQADLVAAFVPGIPHPVDVVNGDQGSAKSTLQKMKKSLIDPSPALTFSPPDSLREFIQQASHHWFIALDNISHLPGWLSDALCRLVTGDGFSKRELYSDDEDVLYALQRVVGLNGINLVVEKPDLLDRSVILTLERVPDDERKEETKLWAEFEEAKPRLLGAVFDTLSSTMALYPNLELKSLPRMADFARWGQAITQALGYAEWEFLMAYYSNVETQNEAAIDASPVGQAVIAFMEERMEWRGSPTELLGYLQGVAEKLKLDTKAKQWPKAPNWLWKRIKEVRPNLLAMGVKVQEGKRGKTRELTLTRTAERNADDTVGAVVAAQVQDGGIDSTDSISPRLFHDGDFLEL